MNSGKTLLVRLLVTLLVLIASGVSMLLPAMVHAAPVPASHTSVVNPEVSRQCHVLLVALRGATAIEHCLARTGNAVPDTVIGDCPHLVTPWVAYYSGFNFSGNQLCFQGRGFINLKDFTQPNGNSWDHAARSINCAANGTAFDKANGEGSQLSLYYGLETGRLDQLPQGNWADRIASFELNS